MPDIQSKKSSDIAVDNEPSRRERKKKETRAKLIDAIYHLTATQGLESVTIRDVATEADIGLGSFYSYFDSKEALLDEAIVEIMFKSGELIDATVIDFDDPVYKVATAFTMFEKIVRNDPIFGWFLIKVQDYRPELGATMTERLKRDVEQGIEKGVFDVPDLDVALRMIGVSVYAFHRDRLLDIAKPEDIPHHVHMLLRAIGTDDEKARLVARDVWKKQLD